MTIIKLKSDVLSWKASFDSTNFNIEDGWDRPYLYLDLAYKIIRNGNQGVELIDAIANLKRAIDNRIKKISKDYGFKALKAFGLPKDNNAKLELLGLAKPFMLEKIVGIRNLIEHQFSDPPENSRCLELADFVWYFLKSTDGLSRSRPSSVILNCDYDRGYDSTYWLDLSTDKDYKWSFISVSGWVLPDHLAKEDAPSFQVACSEIESKSEFEYRIESFRSFLPEIAAYYDGIESDAIYFQGKYVNDGVNDINVIKSYFSTDLYL